MSRTTARRSSGRQIQRKRSKRTSTATVILVVGGLIVLLVGGLLLMRQSAITVPGEEQIANQGAAHIANPTDPHVPYNSNPPTSGVHWGGGTAPWGVLGQPIADEITTHNMEHGGVIIHYRQDLDQATVDQLTTLARQLQARNQCIVMLPRPTDKLDVPIAMTAWTYLLKLQRFDADTITKFFQAHVGRGPEAICRRGA